MEIIRATYDNELLYKYIDLFKVCFPKAKKYNLEYLRWLYIENPDGKVLGYNAFDDGKLVSHYACIPSKFIIDSQTERGLLSLNTATLPEYQGKGLFTTLAKKTYEIGLEEDFTFVYGVANANSTYGFTNKLGFQLVRPLDAMIGIGSLYPDWDKINKRVQFSRLWSKDSFNWRCLNPDNRLYFNVKKMITYLNANSSNKFIDIVAYLPSVYDGLSNSITRKSFLKLYIGLFPDDTCKYFFYHKIPYFIKPSPLNLIYLNLKDRSLNLDPDCILFSFADFDAF